MPPPDLSIILPVSNQADHIASVIAEYEASVRRLGKTYEFLLVVNGPSDDTLTACTELARNYPSVRTFHTLERGWGRAVRIGLQESTGELVCYTNSARTSPRDLVLLLLYAVVNPEVVVKANRKIRESRRRRFGSLVYNLECRALFDLSCWDINGTPKVFPRQFGQLLSLQRTDDLIDAEFAVVCRREGYPMLEVPIFSTKRHGGASTTSYSSAIKMYLGALSMWRQSRREEKVQPASEAS